jgi:hypothetical protein
MHIHKLELRSHRLAQQHIHKLVLRIRKLAQLHIRKIRVRRNRMTVHRIRCRNRKSCDFHSSSCRTTCQEGIPSFCCKDRIRCRKMVLRNRKLEQQHIRKIQVLRIRKLAQLHIRKTRVLRIRMKVHRNRCRRHCCNLCCIQTTSIAIHRSPLSRKKNCNRCRKKVLRNRKLAQQHSHKQQVLRNRKLVLQHSRKQQVLRNRKLVLRHSHKLVLRNRKLAQQHNHKQQVLRSRKLVQRHSRTKMLRSHRLVRKKERHIRCHNSCCFRHSLGYRACDPKGQIHSSGCRYCIQEPGRSS